MSTPRGVLVAALLLATASAGRSQESVRPDTHPWREVPATGDLVLLGTNALLGGLTAGLSSSLGGGSFGEAFGQGVAGGAGVYLGKRISAGRFDGAGLLGRQVAAVGSSVVRNAGRGIGPLERLTFPVGPLLLDVRTGDAAGLQPKLSLGSAYWTFYGLVHPDLHLNAGASLSSGTPVFDADFGFFEFQPGSPDGAAAGGIIFLAHSPEDRGPTLAHERIHVVQADYFMHTWSRPAEQWLVDRVELPSVLERYVEFDLFLPLLRGGATLLNLDPAGEPFEFEADFLMDVGG